MSDSAPILDTRPVYEGRLLRVDVDRVRVGEQELELEMVRHPGAAAVVALLSDRDAEDPAVLLLRQYRHAAGGTIWEIPAGVLQPGEDPAACARRELREETGATAQSVEHLTTILTTPGFTDERIHLFVATGIRVGEPRHEPDEFIEVVSRPMSAALEMIRSGELADAKSIAALLYVAGYYLGM